MKNLQLTYSIEQYIDPSAAKLIAVNDGINKKLLYFHTNNSILSYDIATEKSNLIFEVNNNIKNVEYLQLPNEICIALESGEVILLNPNNKLTNEVTFCEGGIENMSWSPDQEIVVFVTKAKSIVVMTSSFDPISEIFLDDCNSFGAGDFITVGWGKKETQFHGSEGKQAAKQNTEFIVKNDLSELSQDISISWRGDCEYFAVSFVGINGRMFKVYNKEGVLQYTSEKLNNLGVQLAWRPIGTWIAVPHSLPNKYSIGLFEKNGLKHRDITLRFKSDEEIITNLSWSGDSDILAIETGMIKTKIYIYTISNYHWYLKQVLKFDNKVLHSFWDIEVNEGKTLHILLENGKYLIYRWHFEIFHTPQTNVNNKCVVAVIDGKNILFADFQNKVIPPPMSNIKYECTSEINHCSFLQYSSDTNENSQMCLIDSEYLCSFYELIYENLRNTNILKYIKLKDQKNLTSLSESYKTNHWHWINDKHIIFCKYNGLSTTICLARITDANICSEFYVTGIVGDITILSENEFLIHFIEGEVHIMKIENDQIMSDGHFSSGYIFCEQNQIINVSGENKLISLRSDSNLYINGLNISNDVTSFFITNNFLAFTKLDCLKFYRLIDNKIVNERKIERGGKIVVIILTDGKTILQMPRGNLETIYPRVLSLTTISKLLDQSQYDKAMDLLRKERINLNIIFDHNPRQFIENIDKFLEQISNPQWINLFLSDLQNEDFTKTMYISNYNPNVINYPENYVVENKINYVCENICKKMQENIGQKYVLPIITTYVKTGNLEKALNIIWTAKKNEMQEIVNNKIQVKLQSEEALKYILYLVNVNELFNVALGLYDFGLVLFVANKSQKDPKEYVPFLNELKQYDENYKRFKIDLHLKRYEKAIENISKCVNDNEKFEEALELIQQQELFQKALTIYKNNTVQYKKISLAFADYLRTKGKFENASIMYERGGDLSQAILSAKHVLDWQRCIKLTTILYSGDQEEIKKISISLAIALEANGRYDKASYLLLKFSQNLDDALFCMVRGRLFLKALFEANLNKPEFILSNITPNLISYSEILQTGITTDEEIFKKYLQRLEKVRKDKSDKTTDTICEDTIDECDLLSEAGSMNSSKISKSSKSSGTGKTFRSSKNRRKHERKLLSLKEGNPFEDIALIDALHNHITKITNQQQNIRDTCKALMEINNDEIARTIQHIFRNLLLLIKNSLDIIWIPDMQMNPQQNNGINIDYIQYINNQHFAMLDPLKRYKPHLNIIDWEHNILK